MHELQSILKRAEKLSAAELKELTESVGIKFQESENEILEKQDYLEVLDEADNLQKVLAYLTKKGV